MEGIPATQINISPRRHTLDARRLHMLYQKQADRGIVILEFLSQICVIVRCRPRRITGRL